MGTALETVLILLAAAVLVVGLFRTLNVPPLVGYLCVGLVVGPHALGLVPETESTDYLAEFGVVFLMFSIGLEFSLPRLFQMRRLVLGLGGAQVLVTMAAVTAITLPFFHQWPAAIAVGGALAMSSTAIVVRMLVDRLQLDTPHGRATLGILLMQDLAVVPLLIVIPALGGSAESMAGALGLAAVKAAVALSIILFFGQRLMRPWFHAVARRRSHELFITNVLLITLGLAYLTEIAGLSLALGAFLAGMLISETEYRHQVEEDIKPFREVLLGLFFVTVGMKLDVAVVAVNVFAVLGVFALTTVLKFAIMLAIGRVAGSPTGTAMRTALALAQAGEFGLVLMGLASARGVVDPVSAQVVTAGMLLSMLAAPLLIHNADRIVLRFSKAEWMLRSLQLHQVAVQSLGTERHIIICGFGRTGQSLARFLQRAGVSYVALDLDPDRVREAAAAGETVVYGDASRRETLVAAGASRAAAIIISYADTASSLKVLHVAHEVAPNIPVVVRTADDAELDRLTQAGAAEVVPETFESSLILASNALLLVGVPVRRVLTLLRDVRKERYRLLRGFYSGTTDEIADMDEAVQPRLHSVTISDAAYAVGRSLGELSLAGIGADVTAVRRRNIRAEEPGPETTIRSGDVVVLLGTPEALEAAEMRLLQGVSLPGAKLGA
jgi:monovalent cation:H+ antiporter-2, CPA2 family